MLRYTAQRLLLVIPTLIAVAILVFFLVRVLPGDPVEVNLIGEFGDTHTLHSGCVVSLHLVLSCPVHVYSRVHTSSSRYYIIYTTS